MNPIEIKARREALGLSQEQLGHMLGGVSRSTISTWEMGTRAPRDPVTVHMQLCQAEDVLAILIDEAAEAMEHASGVHNSPSVRYRTYASDADFWARDARAKAGEWAAALHRVAAAHAAAAVRDEYEIAVEIY